MTCKTLLVFGKLGRLLRCLCLAVFVDDGFFSNTEDQIFEIVTYIYLTKICPFLIIQLDYKNERSASEAPFVEEFFDVEIFSSFIIEDLRKLRGTKRDQNLVYEYCI